MIMQPITKEATMIEEFKVEVGGKVLSEIQKIKTQKQRRGIKPIKKLKLHCEIIGMARAMKIMCET